MLCEVYAYFYVLCITFMSRIFIKLIARHMHKACFQNESERDFEKFIFKIKGNIIPQLLIYIWFLLSMAPSLVIV